MALHDYTCPGCDAAMIDRYVPIAIRATQLRPVCVCGYLMEWRPQVGRMDAMSIGTAFETPIRQPDGTVKIVRVDSLSTIRRLERESEQRYANGEGAPLRWRDYSHDRGRMYENSFGADPAQIAHEETKGARARFSVVRHGETEPDIALGAGVTDATVSVLGAGA